MTQGICKSETQSDKYLVSSMVSQEQSPTRHSAHEDVRFFILQQRVRLVWGGTDLAPARTSVASTALCDSTQFARHRTSTVL